MSKKMSYTEVALMLREASNHCLEKSGTYSSVCGVYESILSDLVADLPASRQADVQRSLATTRSYIEHVYTPTPSMGTQESS